MLRHKQKPFSQRNFGYPGEDAPLQIERHKQTGVRKQHFGLAQHQKALGLERKMKAIQDVVLRLGIKVHQGVAADEQVNARDGRVLHQIMPPEDDRAPQVFAEGIGLVMVIKVFFEKPFRDIRHFSGGIGRLPGSLQRVFVKVGSVNLDTLGEAFYPQPLRNNHGGGISLLPGGTTRAPDTDHLVLAVERLQNGQHFLSHKVPGGFITKETRHINQNRIKQMGILIMMHL